MERLSPKTHETLPGSLHAEYMRCGKARCRCMKGGQPHGPYWRRFWRENGRTYRSYVPLAALQEVAAACARHQEQHPSGRALRRLLRAYDARLSEVLATLQQRDVTAINEQVDEREAQP